MTRQLTKHIEERIEEIRFHSAAYKAVHDAALKFDGKVLNKRIDAVIKQNLFSFPGRDTSGNNA